MPRTAWNKRLTPEIESLIVTQYQAGQSASEILQTIPFKTRKTVYDVLAKNAIPRRSPRGLADYKKLREAIFANLDTPAKAYWIGVLLSDGYVTDTRKGCQPQIGLQMIDLEVVEKFRDFLWLICALGVSPNGVHRNGSIAFVQWSHSDDIVRIGRYLYQDADVYMERKFALIAEYL